MYYYMLYDISTGKNTLEMFFKGLDKECMKKTEKFKRTTYFSCSVQYSSIQERFIVKVEPYFHFLLVKQKL